jgi:hypothetical protein
MAPSLTTLSSNIQTSPIYEKTPTKSVNVRATERMVSFLNSLKTQFGINNSESIRRGIALLLIAKEQEAQGLRLAFVNDDNEVITIVRSL